MARGRRLRTSYVIFCSAILPNGKIKLEPKQDTKERLGRSPDGADAFVLTFAETDVLVDTGYRSDRYAKQPIKGARGQHECYRRTKDRPLQSEVDDSDPLLANSSGMKKDIIDAERDRNKWRKDARDWYDMYGEPSVRG
jgi:hypothetical protein